MQLTTVPIRGADIMQHHADWFSWGIVKSNANLFGSWTTSCIVKALQFYPPPPTSPCAFASMQNAINFAVGDILRKIKNKIISHDWYPKINK